MARTTEMAPTRRKSGNGPSRAESKSREQELEAQIAQLQGDLKAITDTLRKLTGEKAGEVRSLAETEFRQLRRQGRHLVEEAQDQFGEYETQIKDTIRAKPLTAVAGALGIGFILALLTTRN